MSCQYFRFSQCWGCGSGLSCYRSCGHIFTRTTSENNYFMSIFHRQIFDSGHRMVSRKFSNVTGDNINSKYQASSPLDLGEDTGYIQPSFGTLGGFFLWFLWDFTIWKFPHRTQSRYLWICVIEKDHFCNFLKLFIWIFIQSLKLLLYNRKTLVLNKRYEYMWGEVGGRGNCKYQYKHGSFPKKYWLLP